MADKIIESLSLSTLRTKFAAFPFSRIDGSLAIGIQVHQDGIVVTAGGQHHKEMPNGMGHGYHAVRLEEHDAQDVEGTAELQLQHPVEVVASEDHHQGRSQAHHQVEERLQALVALVEELQWEKIYKLKWIRYKIIAHFYNSH